MPFAFASEYPPVELLRKSERVLAADLVRRCRLNEFDELECLWRTVATINLARELCQRVVGGHADSNSATVEVSLAGAVDVEAELAVLLLLEVAEVTDTDVAVGGILGSNTA